VQVAPGASQQDRMQQIQQMQQRNADNNQRLIAAATPYMNAPQLDAYRKQLEGGARAGAGGLAGLMGAGAGAGGVGARGQPGVRPQNGTTPAN
jgi:hypothetical protein